MPPLRTPLLPRIALPGVQGAGPFHCHKPSPVCRCLVHVGTTLTRVCPYCDLRLPGLPTVDDLARA